MESTSLSRVKKFIDWDVCFFDCLFNLKPMHALIYFFLLIILHFAVTVHLLPSLSPICISSSSSTS